MCTCACYISIFIYSKNHLYNRPYRDKIKTVHHDAKFIFLLRINNLSNLEILNIDNQFFG